MSGKKKDSERLVIIENCQGVADKRKKKTDRGKCNLNQRLVIIENWQVIGDKKKKEN